MYVVVGASGKTGTAVMEALLARGLPARAVVRRAEQAEAWRARGAEAALADLANEDALVQAFGGARSAYLMNPPAYGEADMFARARQVHAALVAAAERAGVGRIVALSSVGAQHAEGTGNILTTHDLERRLAGCTCPVTVLRAANFVENWGWVLQPARERGVLPSMFLPVGRKLPMQSTTDVGGTATALMLEGGPDRRLVELHGPEDYSPEDAAAVLTDLLGHPVAAAAVPEEAWTGTFRAQGFPERTVQGFCEMFRGFNTGHIAFEGTGETRRGTATLRQALARVAGPANTRAQAWG